MPDALPERTYYGDVSKITELMRRHGLDRPSLAAAAYISERTIKRILIDKKSAFLATFRKMAVALNVHVFDIIIADGDAAAGVVEKDDAMHVRRAFTFKMEGDPSNDDETLKVETLLAALTHIVKSRCRIYVISVEPGSVAITVAAAETAMRIGTGGYGAYRLDPELVEIKVSDHVNERELGLATMQHNDRVIAQFLPSFYWTEWRGSTTAEMCCLESVLAQNFITRCLVDVGRCGALAPEIVIWLGVLNRRMSLGGGQLSVYNANEVLYDELKAVGVEASLLGGDNPERVILFNE